jgi:hypothetical protein
MNQPIQCENCGAVLLEQDLFCGECGAPRPAAAVASEPPASTPPLPVAPPKPVLSPPGPPPAQPARPPETGWRVVLVALVVLGAIACCAGLTLFLLAGVGGSDTATAGDAWLTATLLCLLPIGGLGALFLIAGWVIWRTQLRGPKTS